MWPAAARRYGGAFHHDAGDALQHDHVRPVDDLPADPTVLRTIVRDAGQNLGVYAAVEQPGRVAVGDRIELI